jgi:hypothetical protein
LGFQPGTSDMKLEEHHPIWSPFWCYSNLSWPWQVIVDHQDHRLDCDASSSSSPKPHFDNHLIISTSYEQVRFTSLPSVVNSMITNQLHRNHSCIWWCQQK